MRCINCGIAVGRLRRHAMASLPIHCRTTLTRWLTIEGITLNYVCYTCFIRTTRQNHQDLQKEIVLSQQNVQHQGQSDDVERTVVNISQTDQDVLGSSKPPDDEDAADHIQVNFSLYCSDDEEKQSIFGYTEDPSEHAGSHCNLCYKDIVGFRYVCVQCLDFDLCGGCEANGAHDQHYVLRVPGPRPYGEVQSVLARIRKHLMASMDPIQVADDAISIKSEVKEEVEEEMLQQEADSKILQEKTEDDNHKENREISQDEGESTQDEDDPLQTHNSTDTESVDDSEAEWTPSKEDLDNAERIDREDVPSNIKRYTRTRLTNLKPITEERPPKSNIEITDEEQQIIKRNTQFHKIKPLATNIVQANPIIIQSSAADTIPLPVSEADTKIVLNRLNFDKLIGPVMGGNASQKKRRIIMSTSDYEKFLLMQSPAKKVFTAGVSGHMVNIASSKRQASNVICASSSQIKDNDTNSSLTMACLQCTSAIYQNEQYYAADAMGPEIISVIEQYLGHRVDENRVICSQCFGIIMQEMSSDNASAHGDHELQHCHHTNVCVRCRKSLFRRRTHSIPEGAERQYIAETIAPREIPEGGLLCFACWVHTRRTIQQQGIIPAPAVNMNTCVWCRRSLAQTRSHSIPEGPERAIITQKIYPRECPPGGLVCYACWVAARRNVEHARRS